MHSKWKFTTLPITLNSGASADAAFARLMTPYQWDLSHGFRLFGHVSSVCRSVNAIIQFQNNYPKI